MVDKIQKWLKKYWYYALFAAGGLLLVLSLIVFRGKSHQLSKVLIKNLESYNKKIRKLDEIREEEVERKAKNEEEYREEAKQIDQEEQEAREKVEEAKAETVTALSAKDSEELAAKLKEEFKI